MENKIIYSSSKIIPTTYKEEHYLKNGYQNIAGVDEVGRGCIAGPLVAGAVIMNINAPEVWYSEVRDSKKISIKKRERLAILINQKAIATGIGSIPHQDIDRIGIVESTAQAMNSAVNQLCKVDFILVDALPIKFDKPSESIIYGDSKIFSIACASIIAKVFRDELMNKLDELYPGYNFKQNKGYPTKKHLIALQNLGPSPIHRRSFGPVKAILN